MSFAKKIFVTLLLAMLLGCAGAGQKTGVYVDDSTITTKVKAKLFNDPVTSGWNISVITESGVVQLAGFVKTTKEKDRAGDIASTVEGVKAVKNNLVIK